MKKAVSMLLAAVLMLSMGIGATAEARLKKGAATPQRQAYRQATKGQKGICRDNSALICALKKENGGLRKANAVLKKALKKRGLDEQARTQLKALHEQIAVSQAAILAARAQKAQLRLDNKANAAWALSLEAYALLSSRR